jgi:PIN domain nuclease of toxin-antitoxin system
MSAVVADTQAVLWYLFDTPRLSAASDHALTTAAAGGGIFVSTITLVELAYLLGKKTFPYPTALTRLHTLIADPAEPVDALDPTVAVAQALTRVPRAEVPDMPDRVVAATAVAHSLPVVSADADLRGSAALRSLVPVVW